MNSLEDAGGYFCGRCGQDACTEKTCKTPTRFFDVSWYSILATLKDSTKVGDTSKFFQYNERVRERDFDKLEEFCHGFLLDDRITHARHRWMTEKEWHDINEDMWMMRAAIKELREALEQHRDEKTYKVLEGTERAARL